MRKRNIKIRICTLCLLFFIIIQNADSYQDNNLKNFNKIQLNFYQNINITNGDILYVGGLGANNYSNISDALNTASDGDTIFVYDDSSPYNENIEIFHSIILEGENRETTIIDGQGDGDTIYCEADNVVIHGFTIKNGYIPGGFWWIAGIQLYICDYCNIYDNNLMENNYGIRLYGAPNCTITSNTISSNKIAGIYFHDHCHNSEITDNIIDNNDVAGIEIEGTHYSIVNENIIRYNPWDGIRLIDSAYTTVTNNEIVENGYNAIMMRSSYENIVKNNDFTKNGIRITQVHLVENTIENNYIDGKPLVYLTDESDKIIDNAGQVILKRCDRITIKDLWISNVFYGIQTYTCSDCTIMGSIFTNNFCAIDIGYDYPDAQENLKIINNEVIENVQGILVDYCKNTEISENIILNNINSAISVSGEDYKISKNKIKQNSDGIYIRGSKHTISGNIIEKNKLGINAYKLQGSYITGNDIHDNLDGIYLDDSKNNIISKNNIYESSSKDAFFKDSLNNLWRRNYWKKLVGPKIIFGLKYYYPSIWGPPNIIPVFWFDFRPARTPYDVSITEVANI